MNGRGAFRYIYYIYVSADTTGGDAAEGENKKAQRAEHIPAHVGKEPAVSAGTAPVYLICRKFLAADPEEHHGRHQCADGAEVDGADIHPAGNNVRDEHSYNCAHDQHQRNRRYALHTKSILQSLNWGFKKINEGTFIDCKGLTELVIPDSVTSIGTVILSGSGVKTITIPDSVTKIDENAFLNVEKQITVITTKRSAAARLAEKKGIKLQIVDSL